MGIWPAVDWDLIFHYSHVASSNSKKASSSSSLKNAAISDSALFTLVISVLLFCSGGSLAGIVEKYCFMLFLSGSREVDVEGEKYSSILWD